MSWESRVVWSEGMFLRTQHFQQHDRYVEHQLRRRTAAATAHPWGVDALQINQELLAIGKFAVTRCRGLMPDGTTFAIPDNSEPPPPLDIPEGTRNAAVYLTLPISQPGAPEIALEDRLGQATRYIARDVDIVDSILGFNAQNPIKIAEPRFAFALETEELAGYTKLQLARIVEVRADKKVTLDNEFIAPCLTCLAQTPITGFITGVDGRLRHLADELTLRVKGSGGSWGYAEITDWLMLQLINRFTPVMRHFGHDAAAQHPERLYASLIELAGELATFSPRGGRATDYPAYQHHALRESFAPVIADIHRALSARPSQSAISIPLEKKGRGFTIARVPTGDRSLFQNATFYVSAKVNRDIDELVAMFKHHVRFAPGKLIAVIANSQLSDGITPLYVPQVPRELPVSEGRIYFELDHANNHWKELARPAENDGLALHVSGEIGELELLMWAIRGR